MIKCRVLSIVSIATLFVILSLSLPALAEPNCTCIQAEATRNIPGGITYTIVITGSGSQWYDVIKAPSGPRVAGPSQSSVFTSVTLHGGYTYYARVSDTKNGSYSGSAGCTIVLSPTAVEITALTAASSSPVVAIISAAVMSVVAMVVVSRRRS